MTKKVEILAPAGNMQRAKVAIQNGANAVYIGGKLFSARSSADNFSDEEIEELVKYANTRGANVYLAVNTLMKEVELNEAIEFIQKMYNVGVNGFIFQDIGLASYVKKQIPKIEMHASTQLFAHSIKDVQMLKETGFSRVVLARELSLEEIAEIKKNVDVEIEVFVHGALCVCYSGQCLMSSMIGERSGNRGKCAQSCRMNYELFEKGYDDKTVIDGHLLSPRDIMTVEIIDKYIKAGVDSLKIEGRMKNEKYVSQIVSGYREKVDNIEKDLSTETLKNMQQIFNRGGNLIQGYANSYSSKNMMSIETPKSTGLYIGEVLDYVDGKAKIKLVDDVVPADGIEIWTKIKPNTGTNLGKHSKAGEVIWVTVAGKISKGDKVYKSFDKSLDDKLKRFKETVQKEINVSVTAKLNEPLKLKLEFDNICVEKIGDVVETASNKPMTEEIILEKLGKTGGTPYKFNFIDVNIDENIFVSIKGINELRREAISEFLIKEEDSYNRSCNVKQYEPATYNVGIQAMCVDIIDTSYLTEVIETGVDKITVQLNSKNIENIKNNIQVIKESDVKLYLKLPKVTLMDDEKIVDELLRQCDGIMDCITGFEVCNYGEYLQVKDFGKEVSGDYNFTVYNTLTKKHLCENLGFETVTLSPELNLKELIELADERSEVIVYGKLDMMITKQCPVGIYKANKNDSKFCKLKGQDNNYYLRDRKDCDFELMTNCDYCNCTILNSSSIFVLDKWYDIEKVNAEYFKLVFTTENKETTLDIIKAYINQDSSIKGNIENLMNITNGHFYRGVL